MKSFMKFIVTIIVIALIGYIVYYLVINNTEGLNNTSGDFISSLLCHLPSVSSYCVSCFLDLEGVS